MKNFKFILFLSFWGIVFGGGIAYADWQSTLSAEFPFAQTFNDLNDWTATGYGDVNSVSLMPIKSSTGNVSVWRYYSQWASSTGNKAIQNHGAGLTVNPWGEATTKSLLIDLYYGKGPSRLAADIRTATFPNGFKWKDGVRVFYAMRRNTGFWSSSPSGYSKEAVLNMECNNVSCSAENGGANYASAPYFDYHWTHENGVNPAVLISNSHGYIREDGVRTDMRIYNDQWIFVEHLCTQDAGSQKARLSTWIYDSTGKLLNHLYDEMLTESSFSSDEWSSVSEGYFDNFMFGGNMYTPGSNPQVYFDDLIIDIDGDGAIAPRYFSLANKKDSTNTTDLVPPSNLRISAVK